MAMFAIRRIVIVFEIALEIAMVSFLSQYCKLTTPVRESVGHNDTSDLIAMDVTSDQHCWSYKRKLDRIAKCVEIVLEIQ